MGKSENTYTIVVTYESAASFGKIQGKNQDGTVWKNAMKTFQTSPKLTFTFDSTYFETDIKLPIKAGSVQSTHLSGAKQNQV